MGGLASPFLALARLPRSVFNAFMARNILDMYSPTAALVLSHCVVCWLALHTNPAPRTPHFTFDRQYNMISI